MEQEGQGLEAMLHWQDPVERLRTIRRRRHMHSLVGDNPASGDARIDRGGWGWRAIAPSERRSW